MRSPLDTLHTLIVLDPDAKYSPFGENTTLHTLSLWPMRVLMRSPLDTFHTSIVESSDPDAKYSPFGENTTLNTPPEWPVNRTREHIEQLSILDIYSRSLYY